MFIDKYVTLETVYIWYIYIYIYIYWIFQNEAWEVNHGDVNAKFVVGLTASHKTFNTCNKVHLVSMKCSHHIWRMQNLKILYIPISPLEIINLYTIHVHLILTS